ncbi:MAG: hypothetical protein ACFE8G_15955, partial [Candidatus Hermodarchaeota archaeon]
MNNIKTKDPIISKIIGYLEDYFKEIVISVYGIGSYFDKALPTDWKINDIDVLVIVSSLEKIPKLEWTEVRYETRNIENYNVWLGYNTLRGLKEKEVFAHESFANYEWSLLDLKCQENSQLLYGKDIRNHLPKISDLKYDYDDIFARCLYHLDKSLKESKSYRKSLVSEREFTKAVFKFGFFICKYFDKNYYLTSVHNIIKHVERLPIEEKIRKNTLYFMNESNMFRRTYNFSTDFKILRKNFTFFIFSLLRNGNLHRKLEFYEIINFLENKFNGLPFLTKYIKTAKKIYNSSK